MIEEIFKNLQTILIVVLVAVVLFMRNCDKPTPTEPKEIIKTRVEYINVRDTIPQYIPKWKDRVIVVTDTIKEPIDTSLVLTDYYSKYYYEDTLTIDTMGLVYVKDTVTQNKIVSIFVKNLTHVFIFKTIYKRSKTQNGNGGFYTF